MPLSKKDAPGNAQVASDEETKPAKTAPRSEPPQDDRTPGQYAEQEVGYTDAEPGSQELLDHAEKFNQAKRRMRFGF